MTEWAVLFTKLASRIPGWSLSGWNLFERHRLARVSMDLAYLAFWHSGMMAPLKRIANGQGAPSDIDELMNQLNETEAEVGATADRLRNACETLVAHEFGMPVARQIEKVLWLKVGPGNLRPRLKKFAEGGAIDPRVAEFLLREIDSFNNDLDEAHKAILASRGAATAKRKPAAGKKRAPAKAPKKRAPAKR